MRDASEDVTLRRSSLADAEGIWRCLDTVARERRCIAMVEAPTLEQVHAFLGTASERGIIQFVALAGPQVVGWCDVIRKPIEGFRHSAVLGMGLLLPYRGRGLGSALLGAVLGEARSQGLSRVELEVYRSNGPAIHLYERLASSARASSDRLGSSTARQKTFSAWLCCFRLGRALPNQRLQLTAAVGGVQGGQLPAVGSGWDAPPAVSYC